MRDSETTAPTHGGEVTMPSPRPREEAVRQGKEIYERDILTQVEADHFGEYVAIDIETGE